MDFKGSLLHYQSYESFVYDTYMCGYINECMFPLKC